MLNPWTKEKLESFIGHEESHQLEFKSSLGLLQDSDNKVDQFFDDLTCHVSGFLNWEGGLLVIGIEETRKDPKNVGKALALSAGVPRSRWNGDRVERKLCGRIHPSVGSYVKVHIVKVGSKEDEDLLAFVVEVKQGITAYQAADKHYFARQSFSSVPMDDKNIRLLMLTDEKPRGTPRFEVSLETKPYLIEEHRSRCAHFRERKSELASARGSVNGLTDDDQADLAALKMLLPSLDLDIAVRLILSNTGTVTIREGAVAANLQLSNQVLMNISSGEPLLKRFSFNTPDDSMPALYPDMERCIREWQISLREALVIPTNGTVAVSDVSIYLDNGPAIVLDKDFDLTEEVFNIINAVKRKILEE